MPDARYREALEAIRGSDGWPGLDPVEMGCPTSNGRYKSAVARMALTTDSGPIPSECSNPHSRAKFGLTEGVECGDHTKSAPRRLSARGHGIGTEVQMHDEPTAKLPIIGRERALIDGLTRALNDLIGGPAPSKRTLAEVRRHNPGRSWPTDRGARFEVQIVDPDGEVTGHIAVVTVELDRLEARS